MKDYEINDETLAIMPGGDLWDSVVVEDDCNYEVKMKPLEIVDYSCRYFGSSYEGRKIGASEILNSGYKLPVMVEDTKNLIFFPTTSPVDDDCSWISLKNIKNYTKLTSTKTEIEKKNGKVLTVDISYNSFNNQVMRASRLESIIRSRKEKAK